MVNLTNKNKVEDQNSDARKITSNLFLIGGFGIFCFMALIVILAALIFIFGMSLPFFIFPLAAMITTVMIFFISYYYFGDKGLFIAPIAIMILTALFILFYFTSIRYYDMSWDGQEYHQTAIIKLVEGFNPLYESVSRDIAKDDIVYVCVNHYPKAYWICAASLVKLTRNIESGKTFNLLVVAGSLFLTLAAFLRINRIRIQTAVIASLLMAFNPVNIYQMMTYYVDGALGSIMLALFAVSTLIFLKKTNVWVYSLASILVVLLVNIKFTGLVYALAIIAGLFIAMGIRDKSFKILIRPGLLFGCVLFVALIVVGSNSYVKNFVTKGHPLHPVMGSEKRDIMGKQYPLGFRPMNRFNRLQHSIFSKAENGFMVKWFKESYYKIPFTFTIHEVRTMAQEDTRVSGWGPLIGGAIILSFLIVLGFSIRFIRKRSFRNLIILLGPGIWILMTIFINSESWWARFAPQVWILPIVAVLLVDYFQDEIRFKMLTRFVTFALIVVLLMNIGLVAGSYSSALNASNQKYHEQFERMSQAQKPVYVNLVRFETAIKEKFKEYNIDYRVVKKVDENQCSAIGTFDTTYGEVVWGIAK